MDIIEAIKNGTKVPCCCGENLAENKIVIRSYKYSSNVNVALAEALTNSGRKRLKTRWEVRCSACHKRWLVTEFRREAVKAIREITPP